MLHHGSPQEGASGYQETIRTCTLSAMAHATHPRAARLVLLISVALAGCSGDDDGSDWSGGTDASPDGQDAATSEDGSVSGDASLDAGADLDSTAPSDAAPDVPADTAPDAAEPPPSRTRYPVARHSPMSPFVVARLRAVLDASSGRKNVFAKLGDSITVSSSFLGCFAGSDVDWAAYGALEPSRAWFSEQLADASHTSFNRTTLAAVVGWSAKALLTGAPTPLDQEFDAIQPAFAVIMFGTNDTYETGVHPFERNLMADIDAVLARGAVPLMSTIPPRGDSAAADALVPEMNAVIRAIAQARQVPLMDYGAMLEPLPDYGLASDGVHPQVYSSGGVHACWFTDPALQKGMNVRNLITMEALDRAKRFLIDGQAAEVAPAGLTGQGTLDAPWEIPGLPFVDDADTAEGVATLAGYGCSTADEGGPELVYRVVLDGPKKLRARVFCDDGVDVDLYWLDGKTAADCVVRHDRTLDISASAGTYYLVADSFVEAGKALSGKYRLTLVELE